MTSKSETARVLDPPDVELDRKAWKHVEQINKDSRQLVYLMVLSLLIPILIPIVPIVGLFRLCSWYYTRHKHPILREEVIDDPELATLAQQFRSSVICFWIAGVVWPAVFGGIAASLYFAVASAQP